MPPSPRKKALKKPSKRLVGREIRRSDHGKARKPRSKSAQPSGSTLSIYGFHAVEEALKNPARKIHGLYVTKNAAHRLGAAIRAAGIAAHIVEPGKIDAKLPTDAVHQGVLAEAAPLPAIDLVDLPGNKLIVLLDQVTDPQNVGAIMRTACAFGAEALVVTTRNAPPPSGALAKAASGTLEHLPYIQVINLARTLNYLNDIGFQTIGLAGNATNFLQHVADSGPRRRPLALVMGAEGKGIRALTARTCTDLARLGLAGPIKTLNVSNAAAVALSIVSDARGD